MAKNKTTKVAKVKVGWVEDVDGDLIANDNEVNEAVTPIDCAECGGQGLKDTTQLCGVCAGTGKYN